MKKKNFFLYEKKFFHTRLFGDQLGHGLGTNWGRAKNCIFILAFFHLSALKQQEKAYNPNTGWTNEDRYP